MPRSVANNNQKFVPLYSLCPRRMTERLTNAKAPASVWAVIQALKAYAMNKASCFPSHKTIQEYVGGNLPLRTIRYALKWLEDHNFIKRNSRTSKDRYILYIDKHKPIETVTKRQDIATCPPHQTGNELPQKIKTNENEVPPLPSVQRREDTQKPKKRKEYSRKWRTPEERRAAKAERAAARAERQRVEQREAKRTNPIERQKRLINALDWIALRAPVECLMEGDKEHLEDALDEWISGLSPRRRKLFKIECDKTFRSEMLQRIREM